MASTEGLTLSYVISTKRKQLGLTLRQVANDIGLDHSTISKLENPESKTTATPKTLKALSNCLKIDYYFLLAVTGVVDDDPDLRIIARAYKKMSGADRQRMMTKLRDTFPEAFTKDDGDGFSV